MNRKLNEVLEILSRSTKQDLLIITESDKERTNFLREINNKLDKPIISVYITLNAAKSKTTEGVLDLIVEQLWKKLNQNNILDIDESIIENFKSLEFVENVKYLVRMAQKNLPDLKIVLLIDMVEFLLQIKQNSSKIIDKRSQNLIAAVLKSEVGNNLRIVIAENDKVYLVKNLSFRKELRFIRV